MLLVLFVLLHRAPDWRLLRLSLHPGQVWHPYLLFFGWGNASKEQVRFSYLRTVAWCSATWPSAGTTGRHVNRVQVLTQTSFSLSFSQSLTSYTLTLVAVALAGGAMMASTLTIRGFRLSGSTVPRHQCCIWVSTDEQIWNRDDSYHSDSSDFGLSCLSALYNID